VKSTESSARVSLSLIHFLEKNQSYKENKKAIVWKKKIEGKTVWVESVLFECGVG